jgi:tetratricopeptide (TPR) repeat protein
MARGRSQATDAASSGVPGHSRWPAGWPAALFAAFAALSTLVYAPALRGPFVSDDIGYLVSHPYTAELDAESVGAILDPRSPAKLYAANYAPVHLLLTALERQIFADALLGYHLVNVALHALIAVLLVALFRGAGIPGRAALAGGLFFLVHPANVEAVAWASQLKTLAALALSLLALLGLRRWPPIALALFALALLAKASALAALPAAAVWVHCWSDRARARRAGLWLLGWLVVACLYAIPQYASFAHLGAVEVAAFEDPWVQVRTIAAVGMRYLVMAATSYGVSAFQEPAPASSWLDPWWLASLPATLLLGWRSVSMLKARRVEAAFWIAALAAFAPVSQLFPFLNPVADRYLYFILPGLIGGVLLAGRELLARGAARGFSGPLRTGLARAAVAAFALLLVGFAVQSADRARLWHSETLLLLDAARHYPDGGTAHFLRARSAARSGDVEVAVAALREAAERGMDRFMALPHDPGLAPIRDEPAFRALVHEIAGLWIERARRRGYSTRSELRVLGLAHYEREEYADAVAAYEAALRAPGPERATLQAELADARNRLAEQSAAGTRGTSDRTPDS